MKDPFPLLGPTVCSQAPSSHHLEDMDEIHIPPRHSSQLGPRLQSNVLRNSHMTPTLQISRQQHLPDIKLIKQPLRQCRGLHLRRPIDISHRRPFLGDQKVVFTTYWEDRTPRGLFPIRDTKNESHIPIVDVQDQRTEDLGAVHEA